VCHSKHVEQLINIGVINSSTWLHLVGYFFVNYTMMHRSTNIKYANMVYVVPGLGEGMLQHFSTKLSFTDSSKELK